MHGPATVLSRNIEDQLKIPAIESLTGRELQVMMLVFNGLTTNDIGRKLQISPRTVEIYRCNSLKKLRVSNSFLAMMQFLRAGFLGKILENE